MRHLTLVGIIVLFVSTLAVSETVSQHYYTNGRQQPLLVNDSLISVKLANGGKSLLAGLMTSSPVLVDNFEYFGISRDYCVLGIEPGFTYAQAAESLLSNPDISNVNPVFFSPDSLIVFLIDDIILQFDDGVTQDYVDSLLAVHRLTPIAVPMLRSEVRLLHLQNATPAEALTVANGLYNAPGVRYSHPDFVTEISKFAMPNDEFFGDQWNLSNTGQSGGKPGADIDAVEAWGITTGDPEVVVAVIDDGFQWKLDSQHPDVDYSHVMQGYDFAGSIPPWPFEEYPNPDNDPTPGYRCAHGMACAGLIVAQQNNEEGITGIAPGVTLVPLKIFYDDYYCSGTLYQHSFVIVQAIDYSWYPSFGVNANIITCSWGMPMEDAVTAAFERAYQNGVAIFCAAGNYGKVAYPADLPSVMAIGATDKWDRRWFYSGAGDSLDMVAPSEGMLSLDGLNLSGYVPSSQNCNPDGDNNYFCEFGGTSASSPQVAGIAALVLSIRPDLRHGDSSRVEALYSIIKNSSEDQLGDSLDTPGWDKYYGYGRVNAFRALTAACHCGDADADGNIDIGDAVFLIAHIFTGGPAPKDCTYSKALGDANGDQCVDISDAVFLISRIFSGGQAPHCYGM
jgi:subtilisin family serine protease